MEEIYTASYDGALHIRPCTAEDADPSLISALKEDYFVNLMPLSTHGDPALQHATVFQLRNTPSGVVVVYDSDSQPIFCVIAPNALTLAEIGAHYSEVCSNLRYGADIFETKTEE